MSEFYDNESGGEFDLQEWFDSNPDMVGYDDVSDPSEVDWAVAAAVNERLSPIEEMIVLAQNAALADETAANGQQVADAVTESWPDLGLSREDAALALQIANQTVAQSGLVGEGSPYGYDLPHEVAVAALYQAAEGLSALRRYESIKSGNASFDDVVAWHGGDTLAGYANAPSGSRGSSGESYDDVLARYENARPR